MQKRYRPYQKCFMVPYSKSPMKKNNYDLSLSAIRGCFEEVEYEKPGVILEKLLKEEVGEDFFNRERREKREKVLKELDSGIVKELLELREMIG